MAGAHPGQPGDDAERVLESERRRADTGHRAATSLFALEAGIRQLEVPAHQQALRSALAEELDRLRSIIALGGRADDEAPLEEFPLGRALGPVVTEFRAAGMEVRFPSEDASVRVVGRRLRTGEVLAILLENVRRHAPLARVDISVVLVPDDHTAEIRVGDDGPGIPIEERERVLRRGHRRGPGAGSGLGLHIARELLDEQGGTLTVGERPGGGTCIVLRLPLARTQADPGEPAVAAMTEDRT